MSDRFPQYPQMIPNFNNPSLLQQQQQQQQQHPQQPQHQQLTQQSDQHAAYPDQNRMWQQIQFRPRSGMDINQPAQQQTPQQIQDIFRARLSAQNQSMGQQSQPQPQFGIGMSPPQMPTAGAINSLASNQQQSFPDASGNQPQPSHMPPSGFPNMGSMPNQNAGLNAASIAQRNPGILGMQNSGSMNRQLELMLAQQPQSGVLFNPAKMNQQNQQIQQVQQQQRDQQSQQQLSSEMFTSPALSSEALRRPSPSHPPNLASQMQGSMQGPQQHPVTGVPHPGAQGIPLRRNQPPTVQDITERLKVARQNLMSSEAELRSVVNQVSQMHQPQTPEVAQKIRGLQLDVKTKQEFMTRLMHQQQMAIRESALGNGMSRLGPNAGPAQSSWGPQNVPSQVFDTNGAMSRGNAHPPNHQQQPGSQSMHPQPPNGVQQNPSLQTPANNHLMTAGVPRQGPTPNPQGIQPPQQLGSPFPGQINVPANMANKPPPFPMNGFNMGANPAAATAAMQQRPLSGVAYPPPLEKSKFDSMFPNFLHKKNVKVDPALLRLNDQQIDLARLHALVINEGGYQKVNESESWSIIGGRMGFVNFPGSDHEPAKSGPAVAQNLAHVYREYLLELEHAYVRTWLTNNVQMRMNNPGMQQGGMNHPGGGSGGSGGSGLGLPVNGQPSRMSPQLLQYAHMPAAELRQRGIPDHVIALVEQYRPQLQRTAMEQKRFQQQVRMNARNGPGMAGMPVDANGMQPPNQGAMMNDPSQQGGGTMAMLRQQMMMKQQMMGANMDNRLGSLPTQAMLRNPEVTKNAVDAINRMKDEFKKGPQLARFLQANLEIPYDQQAEFNRLLDTTHRQAHELDQKLHLVHLFLPQLSQRVIAIFNILMTQRQLLSTSQPRYILTMEHLRSLAMEVQKVIEHFSMQQQQIVQRTQQFQRMQQQAAAAQQHQHPPPTQVPGQPQQQPPGMSTHPAHPHPQLPPSAVPMSGGMNGVAQSPPGSTMLHHPPTPQSALQQQQPPPHPPQQQTMQMPPQQGLQVSQQPQAPSPSHVQSNRAPSINLQAPPSKRKAPNAPTPSNTAPSPAAAVSVSTPAPTNAPTPTATAASPSAPKSPKGKAPAKQKQTVKRKMSTAPNPPAAPSAPNPTPSQAPEPMQSQTSTSTNGSMKRAREEDTSSGNVAPSPAGGSNVIVDQPSPPKRAKVEWDGPPSEELQQRTTQIENVKTEEDTSNFLVQMSELLKMAGGDSQQDPEFAELSMLLKGCTQVPGSADDLSSFVAPLDPPPMSMVKDELEQYFDFSLGVEDDDSKTPELVPSSSTTDTSPGSNSGNENNADVAAAPTVNEVKNEELTDLTHLGLWGAIDGGESAFYQTTEWKWDAAMPSLDPSWAITTS